MIKQKSDYSHDDIFMIIAKNFERIHQSMEQLTPAQTQSLSNLQQTSSTSWKNIAYSGISILQTYAGKDSVDSNISKISKNLLDSMTDELIKSIKIQSNFTKLYWDICRQNIEEFNKNAEMITELNKNFASFYQKILKNDVK